MFERSITRPEVAAVIASGETVAEYPDDTPFPSYLLSGSPQGRALHVVVAIDETTRTCYVITAYPPDPDQWQADFRTRRPR
jgi:hypothetical protein